MNFRLLDTDEGVLGLSIGLVTNVVDEGGLGRVEIQLPWFAEGYREWARVAQPYAGDRFGSTWIPEENGEVLVLFERGSMRAPYVLGCLYNPIDKPPEKRTKDKDVRTWKSPTGSEIRFDETKKTVEVKTKSGASVLLEENTGNVTVTASKTLTLKATDVVIEGTSSVKVTSPSIALN
ncbi:phage baseplate assembly protein V [Terrabacter sp. RAF57]|uniref:phage baseplate assembly protein V n=1 Tax=Terrabacter sp. RAF57 TaxID=3233063 RepID=UPI003F9B6823